MIPYKSDYAIEKILQNKISGAQNLLKQISGKSVAANEAKMLLKKVENHKWLLSEKLGRDVGIRVATIDYFEHFYQLPTTPKNAT